MDEGNGRFFGTNGLDGSGGDGAGGVVECVVVISLLIMFMVVVQIAELDALWMLCTNPSSYVFVAGLLSVTCELSAVVESYSRVFLKWHFIVI